MRRVYKSRVLILTNQKRLFSFLATVPIHKIHPFTAPNQEVLMEFNKTLVVDIQQLGQVCEELCRVELKQLSVGMLSTAIIIF
jgi:hypothetical protein